MSKTVISVNHQQRMREAFRDGNLDAVKYYVEHPKQNWGQKPLDFYEDCNGPVRDAITGGHIDIVKYLVEELPKKRGMYSFDLSKEVCYTIYAGHLEIIKYLVEEAPLHGQKQIEVPVYDNRSIAWAAFNSRLEIIKYLVEEAPLYGHKAVSLQGDWEDNWPENNPKKYSKMLEFIVKGFFRINETIVEVFQKCNAGTELNQIEYEFICYLLEISKNYDMSIDLGTTLYDVCEYAVMKNDLDEVRNLVEKIATCFPEPPNLTSCLAGEAIRQAARNGQLEILKYVVEEAPKYGQLPVVGPVWDQISEAAVNGYLAVIRYLVEEVPKFGGQIIVDVTEDDNLALFCAASEGYTEIVKYLVEEAPKYGQKSMDLVSHVPEIYGKSVVGTAAFYGKLDVIKYLVEEMPFSTGIFIGLTEEDKYDMKGFQPHILDYIKEKESLIASISDLKTSGVPWEKWRTYLLRSK